MSRIVYEFPSSKRADVESLLEQDPLSRQSVTVKDADAFDLDRSSVFVIVEGDEGVLDQAREDFQALDGAVPGEADDLLAQLDEEEEAAAGGVGFIFGD